MKPDSAQVYNQAINELMTSYPNLPVSAAKARCYTAIIFDDIANERVVDASKLEEFKTIAATFPFKSEEGRQGMQRIIGIFDKIKLLNEVEMKSLNSLYEDGRTLVSIIKDPVWSKVGSEGVIALAEFSENGQHIKMNAAKHLELAITELADPGEDQAFTELLEKSKEKGGPYKTALDELVGVGTGMGLNVQQWIDDANTEQGSEDSDGD